MIWFEVQRERQPRSLRKNDDFPLKLDQRDSRANKVNKNFFSILDRKALFYALCIEPFLGEFDLI